MGRRTFEVAHPGRAADEIYTALRALIERRAPQLKVAVEHDPAHRIVRAARLGFRGTLSVSGDRICGDFDFSFLIPRAIENRAIAGMQQACERLFSDPTG